MQIIARVRNDFPTKFGLPRQSGLVPELVSTIVFEPEYRVAEALRGIETYSHLWLIWGFHQAVREVLESLEPVIEQSPEYVASGVLERLVEPDLSLFIRMITPTDITDINIHEMNIGT